jgi:hypothetical protein
VGVGLWMVRSWIVREDCLVLIRQQWIDGSVREWLGSVDVRP